MTDDLLPVKEIFEVYDEPRNTIPATFSCGYPCLSASSNETGYEPLRRRSGLRRRHRVDDCWRRVFRDRRVRCDRKKLVLVLLLLFVVGVMMVVLMILPLFLFSVTGNLFMSSRQVRPKSARLDISWSCVKNDNFRHRRLLFIHSSKLGVDVS